MTPPSKFFRSGEYSIAYDTPEEMAAFLDAHPECAEGFLQETFSIIHTCVAWGDMRTPRELLATALEAIALHRENSGKSVLR